ncbi:family 16 glycoside hydrolase [Kibdelosporangium persicum]|uniref:Cycloisomaltooligosaccharide glucanotransferase n=1 Tax=Kibdelosporangium persicum TaxID=2698649 RepID=A0ABX2FHB9_9PSEU|nr:family 16 glycoside hydrolase [Kibdelosporangium persicum]NRN70796.1 Cycloisomaltooligosaccharide glucanotransferase [Kibdelosporangium persicum]
MRLFAALLAAAIAVPLLPAHVSAEADIPPQEPGVTMRVFDVQVPLTDYCKLKPGQTPNIDKMMPVIDWSGNADFGIADRFVTEVSAYLHVTSAGTYDFRLTSDDGARLLLDGIQVIDHPGRHGATPKDGSIPLAAGHHALRIDHFDADFDQRLKLEWRPPGASGYTVVPNSALSTDADVVRVTSPGRKQCEGVTDSPGDGLPLTGVHPAYTLTNLRPDGFEPQVTGMDWLPDGRLAISTWGGDRLTVLGEVFLLDGVTGTTDPSKVTVKRIAHGLREPMGLKYVDGTVYVSEKHQLTALVDNTGDEVADDYRRIATWPFGGNYHEFAFGLLYKDGYFYVTTGIAMVPGGATANPQPANRGSTLKINRATGDVSYVASGLRTPNGLGWGPEGDVFVTDNQGMFIPASKLVRIKHRGFYNHYINPAGPYDTMPVTEPVLWLPHNEISNSPSNPIVLPGGLFEGQMVFGDVTYGGLQRAYLEKVGGEYQGAVFRMTQGLESGVSRISLGPDGAIYTGGIGWEGNWGQAGKLKHGLQKLSLGSSADAFDIHSMRAVSGGFELEYTQPLSDETVKDLAAKYKAQQWRYVPTPQYGGPKVDEENLGVTSATLSPDRKKVTLTIAGLKPGRVVYLRSPRPFSSASGAELWSTEAWYTLNRLPDGTTAPPEYEAESARLTGGTGWNTNHTGYSGAGFVDRNWEPGSTTTFAVRPARAGRHDIALRYANGPNPSPNPVSKSMSLYVNGKKEKQIWLAATGSWSKWATHVETVTLRPGPNTISYVYEPTDTGHVNLDKITVTPTNRVTLFDGTGLGAWETTSGGPATWPVANGSMESFGGDIRTKERFGDFRMHVEWYEPDYPPEVTGQARGNSGVYIYESYELQVLESYGRPPELNGAGSLYLKKAPDVNAAGPTGTWQTYDIEFRAARFDMTGKKVENARITVWWNGKLVHNNVPVDGPTGAGKPEDPAPGQIKLQDHNDPGANPRFRNIWIERL